MLNSTLPLVLPNLAGRTVCIVDDDKLIRTYIGVQLQHHGLVVLEAANSAELIALVRAGPIDCILMDFSLASENGLFVQDLLRDTFILCPPIIMLSANDNERTIIKAFRTGVSDYLIKKDLRIEELLESLRAAISRRAREDGIKTEMELLKRQSLFDEVTSLYRRSTLDDMLAALVKSPARTRKPFAVVIIGSNQLDHLTETVGQVAGQQLVGAFAARLKSVVRAEDVCGRFDASTFLYLVDTAATPERVNALADRLKQTLQFRLDLKSVSLDVSAHLAVSFYPADGTDVASILACAQLRLDETAIPEDGPAMQRDHPSETSLVRTGERRLAPRSRVLKAGKIITNGGTSVVDCRLRDLSDTGARLRLSNAYSVPACFDLLVVGSSAARPARLVWQRGADAGVAFIL